VGPKALAKVAHHSFIEPPPDTCSRPLREEAAVGDEAQGALGAVKATRVGDAAEDPNGGSLACGDVVDHLRAHEAGRGEVVVAGIDDHLAAGELERSGEGDGAQSCGVLGLGWADLDSFGKSSTERQVCEAMGKLGGGGD